MKITNRHSLPAPLVTAITNDNYSKDGAAFSVTELIKPPRIAALEVKHWDELEEDASERLWLLMGKAGHEVLRRSSKEGIVEETVTVEFQGIKLKGQMDYAVSLKALWDYKFTSVWAVKEGVKPEWEQQLNIYKWMAEQYGVEVNDLTIIAILRDWSKPEARRDKSYVQSQVMVLPVRVWEKSQVERFVSQRIEVHLRARNGHLPDCTPEEVWERPEKYAVMKKGNVRASRVLDTKLEAGQFAASQPNPSQYTIEIRPAERPRCEDYCSVSDFCQQFKAWKANQL